MNPFGLINTNAHFEGPSSSVFQGNDPFNYFATSDSDSFLSGYL